MKNMTRTSVSRREFIASRKD